MQVAALCGVHCLNTLLQGPVFTEWDLAECAHQLDALERQMMQEGGMHTDDYARFVAEGSSNVSADGMFSSQVHATDPCRDADRHPISQTLPTLQPFRCYPRRWRRGA